MLRIKVGGKEVETRICGNKTHGGEGAAAEDGGRHLKAQHVL